MVYDREAESIALIRSGNEGLLPVARLSRRRRFVPMAVDRADDFAATMFLRRSVGRAEVEIWLLANRRGSWQLLGGGGGPPTLDDPLAPRPVVIPHALRAAHAILPGIDPSVMVAGNLSGTILDTQGQRDLFPWGGRRIHYLLLFASARVGALRFQGRTIAVPWHGQTLLSWVGSRSREVSACSEAGEVLGTTRIAP